MALGYCAVCDKLVPIRPAGHKWAGDRQREWFPVPHGTPSGQLCAGDKRAL